MTGPRFLRMNEALPKADSSGWVPLPASPDSSDGMNQTKRKNVLLAQII